MRYHQPFDQPLSPNAGYIDGNPSTGVPGSIPPAAAIETPQREIVAAIQAAGLTPDDGDLQQLLRAVRGGTLNYSRDNGVQNALAIAKTPVNIGLMEGMQFRVRAAFPCTGPSTLQVDGISPVHIRKGGSVELSGGEFAQFDILTLEFDGTYFQLTSVSNSAGLLIQNSVTFNVPGQYPTIRAALLAAGSAIILPNVYINIVCAAGYVENLDTTTGPLYLSHPFGQRVRLLGPALAGAFPTTADLVGKTAAQALTFLKTRFQVVINCVGVNGIELHSGAFNSVQNILFVGDGSAGQYGALIGNWSGEVGMGSIGFQNMGFHGFGADNVRAEQTSVIQVNNIVSTFPTRACFWLAHFSSMECNFGSICAYRGQYGIASFNSAMVMIDSASGTIDIRSPSSHGIYMPSFGKFNAIPATGVTIQGCGGWGCLAYEQSQANFSPTVTFASNVSGDIYADFGSVCMAVGATLGTCSPAKNTGGNHYSYIQN